ncbi:hypothetical protein [Citricoccus sp. I39-566]|uniref:hypothetical protein n=1 Tax=Citricoccus sp. I39-566 TaxID=3073268 RepID=UPI00286A3FAA|nr:hypothetical protein [Citricoccus sp. I39-566]WMY77743.1 hypothetical protein RE421_13045 [Citricoccus sp. I39-566]
MQRRPRPRPEAPELRLLDPAEGAWVAGMLEAGARIGHVASTVPVGEPAPYEAIARILHPVPWHHRDWTDAAAGRLRGLGLVPEDYADFRDEPSSEVRTLNAYGTTTWRQVAADHGTEVHAGAQWADLARVDGDGSSFSRLDPGLEYDAPSVGTLGQPAMGFLAEVLLRHTGTPRDLVLGLWPGFGWMDGGGALFGPAVEDATGGRHSSLSLPPAFGPRTTRALRRGTGLLDVGGGYREYLLVPDDGTRLRRPEWTRAVHPAFPAGDGAEYQSPQLAWPRDRAWALASEIDLDSTLVAGSAALVRAICTHPGLEAVVVRPDTDLTAFAGTVNHRDPAG